MSQIITTIESDNISFAWLRLFHALTNQKGTERGTVVTKLQRFEENEDIRNLLNKALTENKKQTCETVAKTIFPYTIYERVGNREKLYEKYMKILPQLKKFPANRRGTYFQRSIHYDYDKEESVNQLEIIIQKLSEGSARRSGLQIAIFDPAKDHTSSPRMGFPCLHQISFVPTSEDKIILTALYPMHYIFERFYGNLLGLLRLAEFVSKESGKELDSIICVSGVCKLDIGKSDAKTLLSQLERLIEPAGGYGNLNTTLKGL